MPYNSTSYPKKKPETVIKAIHLFLAWLAQGKAIQSFSYRDPENKDEYCSWQTVLNYLADKEFVEQHNLAFVAEHKILARAEGYSVWEKVCEESAKGLNKEANTASLQMIMRNKFGWDKPEEKETISPEAVNEIKNLAEAMKKPKPE